MQFNSIDFGLFFALTFALYLLAPARWRAPLLLLASLYQYGTWNGKYLALVVVSALVDYGLSHLIYRRRGQRSGRLALTVSILYNLSILAYFKYASLIVSSLAYLSVEVGPHHFDAMPIGISFFTFQSMGYAIDVWRGRTVPARRALDYILFVSYFPQMMSGPIERANGLLRQLEGKLAVTPASIHAGAARVLWGLFQKNVVADNLALSVNAAFSRPAVLDGPSLLLAVVMFTFQLYADFAGYCDMAIGMSMIFGIRLSENFRAPILARSVTEIWARWNITLMAWFRDYLYFPLAGRSRVRGWLAVLFILTLSGLWHGPDWHYALWGLLNGLLLLWARGWKGLGLPALPRWPARLLTCASVAATLLFFRASSIHEAFFMATRVLERAPGVSFTFLGFPWEGALGAAVLILVDVAKEPLPFHRWFLSLSSAQRTLALASMMLAILLFGAKTGVRFLYLQF